LFEIKPTVMIQILGQSARWNSREVQASAASLERFARGKAVVSQEFHVSSRRKMMCMSLLSALLLAFTLGLSCSSPADLQAPLIQWGDFDPHVCGPMDDKILRLPKAIASPDSCAGEGTSVVVVAASQVLFLCEQGHLHGKPYDISIGWQGFGKRQEGDHKSPVGTYELAPPRQSDEYGLFIHVAFPTAAQVEAGYTGSDIGIHGPPRTTRCAGVANVKINWTEGCYAVSSDAFIDEISQFVAAHPGALLHVL
jgi:hypothetical protein